MEEDIQQGPLTSTCTYQHLHACTHAHVYNGQARPARCTQGLTAPQKARVLLCDQMDNPTTASSIWDTENGE